MISDKIRTKAFKLYRHSVYPRLSKLRGATRLNEYLSRISLFGLETVDDSNARTIFEFGEWDNLIILDACRYDLFREVMRERDDLNGSLYRRVSVGSRTSEYLKKTYSDDETYPDTVYVTGNPHFFSGQLGDELGLSDKFATIYETYRTDWDDELGTVKPEPIVRDMRNASKLFDKKIIGHFMQPHHPMVPEPAGDGFSKNLQQDKIPDSVWGLAEQGVISQEEAWKRYKDNLNYVLDHVLELAEELEGKTVITSDHGNVVGENGRYGHPKGSNAKVLRHVPWYLV